MLRISGIAAVPGVDYNSFVTDEPVDLDDVTLVMDVTPGMICGDPQSLPTGQTYTLVSTTGGLTGRIGRFEEGDVTGPSGSFNRGCFVGRGPSFRINYHESGPVQSVTATVVDGSPTPVTRLYLSTPDQTERQTNQPVTFTARLNVSSGAATGHVSFQDSYPDNDEAACPDQRVVITPEHPGIATCTTSFSASDQTLWSLLQASFEPDDPAVMRRSTDIAEVLVRPGTTTTSIETPASPTVGVPFIATVTVTPSLLGPIVPTETVNVYADGEPLPGCTPYLVSGPAPYATCELMFNEAGQHQVTVFYPGDAGFTASSSVHRFTVEPRRVAPVQPPSAGPLPTLAPDLGTARAHVHAPRHRRAAAPVRCRSRQHTKRTPARPARMRRCAAIHRHGRARQAGG
jgi:hypothetical protein